MNLGPLTPTLSPKGERERSEFAARPDSITTGSALGAEPPTGGEVEKPRIVHGGTPACFARNKVPGTIRLGLGCLGMDEQPKNSRKTIVERINRLLKEYYGYLRAELPPWRGTLKERNGPDDIDRNSARPAPGKRQG